MLWVARIDVFARMYMRTILLVASRHSLCIEVSNSNNFRVANDYCNLFKVPTFSLQDYSVLRLLSHYLYCVMDIFWCSTSHSTSLPSSSPQSFLLRLLKLEWSRLWSTTFAICQKHYDQRFNDVSVGRNNALLMKCFVA